MTSGTKKAETNQFLCHSEELRDVADHIPEAVIEPDVRLDPRWKMRPRIRALKPAGKSLIITLKSIIMTPGNGVRATE